MNIFKDSRGKIQKWRGLENPLAALAININFMSLKVSGMHLVNVPYNEKFSREKTFANFVDFRPSASYIN